MKILFIRHAESLDDLTDQYGGWLDLELTPNGRQQVQAVISHISGLEVEFEKILHSPLKRAKESAQILSSGLKVPMQELVYLKEKNGYGLLTGLTKTEALECYPELVEDMNNGYVFGAEPEEELLKRVKKAYEILLSHDTNLIAVTHGGFLSRLLDNLLDLKYVKAGDAGYLLWDTETREVVASDNFKFEDQDKKDLVYKLGKTLKAKEGLTEDKIAEDITNSRRTKESWRTK
jgi:broad specificity phosphatase PhoE